MTGSRLRLRPAGALLLACLWVGGCAPGARHGPAPRSPVAGAPARAVGGRASGVPGRAAAAPPGRPAGPPAPARGIGAAGSPLRFCVQPAAAGLRAGLARAVPGSQRGELIPLGAAAGGRAAYVSAWTRGFAGVGELDLRTGQLREIQRFADPSADQADGSAAGRWLVWAQTYSLQSLDDFTVYSFDAATGRVRALGRSLTGPGGVSWPSPWHPPAVSGHYGAWAQGYAPGGLVQIRLADLATGQVRVIRAGHVQPPFFDGGLVVWPESDSPGSQTTLHAYSLATGRSAPLPAVLRAVHGTEFVATDGARTAYLSPDLTELYYSPAQQQRAAVMLRLPGGVTFAGLTLSARALAWTTSTATYLASTETGAYSRVTAAYGYATAAGPVTLVSDAPSVKAAHPALALHVVSVAALASPRCARA